MREVSLVDGRTGSSVRVLLQGSERTHRNGGGAGSAGEWEVR